MNQTMNLLNWTILREFTKTAKKKTWKKEGSKSYSCHFRYSYVCIYINTQKCDKDTNSGDYYHFMKSISSSQNPASEETVRERKTIQ